LGCKALERPETWLPGGTIRMCDQRFRETSRMLVNRPSPMDAAFGRTKEATGHERDARGTRGQANTKEGKPGARSLRVQSSEEAAAP
jgi:hypothetical protein